MFRRKDINEEEKELDAELAFIQQRKLQIKKQQEEKEEKELEKYQKEMEEKIRIKKRLALPKKKERDIQLDEEKAIYKKASKKENKPYKEPILLLMRKSGNIDIKEDIKAGQQQIKKENGDEVLINLDPRKMQRIPGPDGATYRGWVHNEDEYLSYPHNIEWDSKMVTHDIHEATQNYKENWDVWGRLGKLMGFKTILIIFIIIGVILTVLAYMNPQFFSALGIPLSQVSQQAAQNITQTGTIPG